MDGGAGPSALTGYYNKGKGVFSGMKEPFPRPDPRYGKAYVGTSGWSYEHWQGVFYPEGLPKKERFAYFAAQIPTVELNATFYHLFPEKTFQGWAEKAPPGFLYAVKMWRRITHYKRLQNVEEDLRLFLHRITLLEDHLGPVLIQLPPGLHRDDSRLSRFLEVFREAQEILEKTFRAAVEFRHKSWFAEEVYTLLDAAGIAFCLGDMPKLEFPRRVTGDFTYLRFHGKPYLYRSLYSEETLSEWSVWLGMQLKAGFDAFVYFNNDFEAHAVHNARQLKHLLESQELRSL
jgi:uncharacterized protein YecE (DUF72 family)